MKMVKPPWKPPVDTAQLVLARGRSCPQVTSQGGADPGMGPPLMILSSTEWRVGRPSVPERPGMTTAHRRDLPAGRYEMASVTARARQSAAQLLQATYTLPRHPA